MSSSENNKRKKPKAKQRGTYAVVPATEDAAAATTVPPPAAHKTAAAADPDPDPDLTVARLPWRPWRRQFRERAVLLTVMAWSASLGVQWAVLDTGAVDSAAQRDPWLVFVLGAVFIVIYLATFMRFGTPRARPLQLAAMLVVYASMTSFFVFIGAYYNSLLVIQASLICIAAQLAVLALTGAWRSASAPSALTEALIVLAVALAAGLLFAFLPHESFFEHPGSQWLDPPASVASALFLVLVGGALGGFFVWQLANVEKVLTRDQWIVASYRVVIDTAAVAQVVGYIIFARAACCQAAAGSAGGAQTTTSVAATHVHAAGLRPTSGHSGAEAAAEAGGHAVPV